MRHATANSTACNLLLCSIPNLGTVLQSKKDNDSLEGRKKRAKKLCRCHLAVLGTVDMLGCLRTVKLEHNVLEPRLARFIFGDSQGVRQPQRDVIPLDHTTDLLTYEEFFHKLQYDPRNYLSDLTARGLQSSGEPISACGDAVRILLPLVWVTQVVAPRLPHFNTFLTQR